MLNKERKESKLKKKIKELKKTSKGRAILRLIKWAIFFFFLFVFLVVSSIITMNRKPNLAPPQVNPSTSNEKDEETSKPITKSFEELQTSLLKGTYNYNYEITVGEAKYIYNGHKTPDVETGYKETNEGIIKYYIDDTGIFKETTTEKVRIDNLYENLNTEYLDLVSIFKIFAKIEFVLNESNESTNHLYVGKDPLNSYEYETNGEEILFIRIYNTEYNYYLSFSEFIEASS